MYLIREHKYILIAASIIFLWLLVPDLLLAADANIDTNVNYDLYDHAPNRGKKFFQLFETQFNQASNGLKTLQTYAMRMFKILWMISLIWTLMQLALKKADLSEFFSEFVKFCMFFGFFYMLLIYAPDITKSIIDSMYQLGGNFSEVKESSNIMDTGVRTSLSAISNVKQNLELTNLIHVIIFNFCLVIASAAILIVFAMIAIDLLLLKIGLILLSYIGMFLLGFGGGRGWTHEIAINYYKTVLGQAVQAMTLMILAGIGIKLVRSFVNQFQTIRAALGEDALTTIDILLLFVAVLILFKISKTLPALVAGIITSAQGGAQSAGSGAGAAIAGMVTGGAISQISNVAKGTQISAKGASSGAGAVANAGLSATLATGRGIMAVGRGVTNGFKAITGKGGGSLEKSEKDKKDKPQQSPLADANRDL